MNQHQKPQDKRGYAKATYYSIAIKKQKSKNGNLRQIVKRLGYYKKIDAEVVE